MKYDGLVLYYVLNQQGDVERLVNAEGVNYGSYKYDAWGNFLQKSNTKYINNNPLRYRGYVYDPETELYYCQSRYYDPKMGRFINGDILASTGQGLLGNNNFAYCGNNPVCRTDLEGTLWDTIFDVVSLCCSIGEVAANPTNVWSWVGLAGDVIDLVPFVSGVGESAKVVGAMITITNKADNVSDTIRVVRATEFTDEAVEAISKLDKVNGATRSTAKAGTAIHAGYKTGYSLTDDMVKEAIRGKNRIDFLDEVDDIIYELKPSNVRGLRDGIKQLMRYNNSLGGGYSMVLELY